MLEEIAAYEAMHAELCQQYLGRYVAIHQGALIDWDPDPIALHKRIRMQFPDKVVLSRKVHQEPERVLHVRSPRLERPS